MASDPHACTTTPTLPSRVNTFLSPSQGVSVRIDSWLALLSKTLYSQASRAVSADAECSIAREPKLAIFEGGTALPTSHYLVDAKLEDLTTDVEAGTFLLPSSVPEAGPDQYAVVFDNTTGVYHVARKGTIVYDTNPRCTRPCQRRMKKAYQHDDAVEMPKRFDIIRERHFSKIPEFGFFVAEASSSSESSSTSTMESFGKIFTTVLSNQDDQNIASTKSDASSVAHIDGAIIDIGSPIKLDNDMTTYRSGHSVIPYNMFYNTSLLQCDGSTESTLQTSADLNLISLKSIDLAIVFGGSSDDWADDDDDDVQPEENISVEVTQPESIPVLPAKVELAQTELSQTTQPDESVLEGPSMLVSEKPSIDCLTPHINTPLQVCYRLSASVIRDINLEQARIWSLEHGPNGPWVPGVDEPKTYELALANISQDREHVPDDILFWVNEVNTEYARLCQEGSAVGITDIAEQMEQVMSLAFSNVEWHYFCHTLRECSQEAFTQPKLELAELPKDWVMNMLGGDSQYREYRSSDTVASDNAVFTVDHHRECVAHHINFNGDCVNERSYTPPEVSFWAVSTTKFKQMLDPAGPVHSKSLLAAQAFKHVDPVRYMGSNADPPTDMQGNYLTGSRLKEAVTGDVQILYRAYGTWLYDDHAKDDHVPAQASEDDQYHHGGLQQYVYLQRPYLMNPMDDQHYVCHTAPRSLLKLVGRTPLKQVLSIDEEPSEKAVVEPIDVAWKAVKGPATIDGEPFEKAIKKTLAVDEMFSQEVVKDFDVVVDEDEYVAGSETDVNDGASEAETMVADDEVQAHRATNEYTTGTAKVVYFSDDLPAHEPAVTECEELQMPKLLASETPSVSSSGRNIDATITMANPGVRPCMCPEHKQSFEEPTSDTNIVPPTKSAVAVTPSLSKPSDIFSTSLNASNVSNLEIIAASHNPHDPSYISSESSLLKVSGLPQDVFSPSPLSPKSGPFTRRLQKHSFFTVESPADVARNLTLFPAQEAMLSKLTEVTKNVSQASLAKSKRVGNHKPQGLKKAAEAKKAAKASKAASTKLKLKRLDAQSEDSAGLSIQAKGTSNDTSTLWSRFPLATPPSATYNFTQVFGDRAQPTQPQPFPCGTYVSCALGAFYIVCELARWIMRK